MMFRMRDGAILGRCCLHGYSCLHLWMDRSYWTTKCKHGISENVFCMIADLLVPFDVICNIFNMHTLYRFKHSQPFHQPTSHLTSTPVPLLSPFLHVTHFPVWQYLFKIKGVMECQKDAISVVFAVNICASSGLWNFVTPSGDTQHSFQIGRWIPPEPNTLSPSTDALMKSMKQHQVKKVWIMSLYARDVTVKCLQEGY